MACTRNCDQGRSCDCVPDVESDDYEDFGPIKGILFVVALWIASAIGIWVIV